MDQLPVSWKAGEAAISFLTEEIMKRKRVCVSSAIMCHRISVHLNVRIS